MIKYQYLNITTLNSKRKDEYLMKKLTAILTSLIMTLSVICQTSVFAAFSDVGDDNTYKDAITTLTKLKVIDG